MQGRHRADRAAASVAPDDDASAHALLDALELLGAAPDRPETLRRLAAVARAFAQAAYAVVEVSGADAPDGRVLEGQLVEGRHERLRADLRSRGVLLGRVLVGRPDEGFAAADRALLERLVALAAPLVLAAPAGHSDGEDAVLADRGRIARDLHDLVVQRLYATGLHLQAAQRADGAAMAAALGAGIRDIDTAIRDLRATIFELGRGLSRSLAGEARGLVEEYAPALGFRPVLQLSGPVDTALTEQVGDEALLVLREALSNIARHAQASAVQVELTASAAWFMLRVTDDGVGIAPNAGVASGLRNAQRRAEALGGVMRTGAVTPHGASLVWLVPTAR